jgi:NAD-dependent dihydropyrimidine dehydrogenase PreA subunit
MPVNIDKLCKPNFGSHYCLLYRYTEDLVDFLVPYFIQGVENGEYCMWVTPDAEIQRIARIKLAESMPDSENYPLEKRIRFMNAGDWYLRGGGFDSDTIYNGWMEILSSIEGKQYKGMRVSGDLGWFDENIWDNLMEYETRINSGIPFSNLIAVCSYPLGSLSGIQIAEILKRHQLGIAKDNGTWQIFNTLNQENISSLFKTIAGSMDLTTENDIIFSHPVIYPEKCNGCGVCIDVCGQDILYLDRQKVQVRENGDCDWCTNCEAVCPAGAIACPYVIA